MGSSTSRETQTATQTIPPEVTAANQAMLARGQKLADLGYIPYMGVDVAGINPAERAAMENVGQMASAFGLAAPAAVDIGMPEVTVGGMTGYSGFPLYEGALERFRETRPDQYRAYAEQLGYDPLTGTKATTPVAVPVSSIGTSAPLAGASQPRADVAAFLKSQEPHRHEGSRMSTGRESKQKYGFVNRDGFIDAPYPSGGFASDIGRLGNKVGDFIEGGGLMGAISRAMSGRN